MNRFFSIPRDALAQLLAASGSTLTPEQYMASLVIPDDIGKYASRARASAWSKIVLAIVAVFSVLWLPFNFDLEDFIIAVGLCTATYFEYRVNRYFREGHPNGPSLGYRNQALFAAAILVYGLYHAFFTHVELPAEYRDMVDPSNMALLQSLSRVVYLIVGLVGGISQYCLALYYRAARSLPVA